MDEHSENPEIDLKKVIDESTSKMTLRALEKRGFKRVRVLNEETIRKLIRQAVDTAIQTRLGDRPALAGSEGEIADETRRELKRLMKEHAESEEAQGELDRRAAALQEHVDALEDELVKQKLDLERERDAIFQRGVLSAHDKIKELEKANAELAAKTGEGGEVTPTPLAPQQLEAMIKTVIESVKAQQSSEEITDLRKELKTIAEHDQKTAEQVKNILREELSKRPVVGGGARDATPEAAEASLTGLFGDFGVEIESNIENVETKEEKSGGVGGALERLKRMKKGEKGNG